MQAAGQVDKQTGIIVMLARRQASKLASKEADRAGCRAYPQKAKHRGQQANRQVSKGAGIRRFGNSGIPKFGKFGKFKNSANSKIREIRKFGDSEIRRFGISEIRKFANSEFQKFGNSEIRRIGNFRNSVVFLIFVMHRHHYHLVSTS